MNPLSTLSDHQSLPTRTSVPMDEIEVNQLLVQCIVGVYPRERHTPQPLTVDVKLRLNTRQAARSDDLSETIDYARLIGEIRFLLESCQFQLLETAADAICRYLLAPPTQDRPRSPIFAAMVKLTKPMALESSAQPSLTIWRVAEEVNPLVEQKPFGTVDILHESAGCGVYRLRIAPKQTIPLHIHQVMRESELILGDRLLLQNRPVKPGTAYSWPRGYGHQYTNPTEIEQTILCVDRPAFLPDDEQELAGTCPDELPPALFYYPRAEPPRRTGRRSR